LILCARAARRRRSAGLTYFFLPRAFVADLRALEDFAELAFFEAGAGPFAFFLWLVDADAPIELAFGEPKRFPSTGVTAIRAQSTVAKILAGACLETGDKTGCIASMYDGFRSSERQRITTVTYPVISGTPALLTEFLVPPPAPRLLHLDVRGSFWPPRSEFPQPTPMATIQSIANENEPHPDVALVERVKTGDISAYDELVRKYDRQIFRIAQHITQNREDAEDVMQDAFLKAYEKIDQFQGNSKFYTWLVRIAVNESLMRLRKRRTGKMVSIDEDIETEEGTVPRDLADWAPDPEQNYTQAELAEILRKTIQGLPPGFRVVFVLRDVDGLSTEETAESLGLSVPAVKSRLLRARLQLRERLARYFKRKKVPREKGVKSDVH
jgi:RNA polymerase sigma-70 factor, ECF subfamily